MAKNLSQSSSANPCRTGASKCQVQVITLGVNWYLNPNMRLMLNDYLTEAQHGNTGPGTPDRTDQLLALSFRTQINF